MGIFGAGGRDKKLQYEIGLLQCARKAAVIAVTDISAAGVQFKNMLVQLCRVEEQGETLADLDSRDLADPLQFWSLLANIGSEAVAATIRAFLLGHVAWMASRKVLGGPALTDYVRQILCLKLSGHPMLLIQAMIADVLSETPTDKHEEVKLEIFRTLFAEFIVRCDETIIDLKWEREHARADNLLNGTLAEMFAKLGMPTDVIMFNKDEADAAAQLNDGESAHKNDNETAASDEESVAMLADLEARTCIATALDDADHKDEHTTWLTDMDSLVVDTDEGDVGLISMLVAAPGRFTAADITMLIQQGKVRLAPTKQPA